MIDVQLNDLYQQVIFDHYKHPHHVKNLDYIPESEVHENPSCGDSIKVDAHIENGAIKDIFIEPKGCAISVSSASMMSDLLIGKTVDEAKAIIDSFINIMRGEESVDKLEDMDELVSLSGVIKYPLRIKCATLAWHSLISFFSKEYSR